MSSLIIIWKNEWMSEWMNDIFDVDWMLALFRFLRIDTFLHFEPISHLKEIYLISDAHFSLKNLVSFWKLTKMSLWRSEQGHNVQI